MELLKDKIRRTLKEYGCDREVVVEAVYRCIQKFNTDNAEAINRKYMALADKA